VLRARLDDLAAAYHDAIPAIMQGAPQATAVLEQDSVTTV
jgi:hypothetical protein